jgi:putative lipoic acid-binding regulatory protein
MAACVEGVVGGLHAECISARPSSGGKYTSVTLTAWVETPDQVLEIFKRMSEDERLKFYI